jgi:SAM-dependent methyltransferase
MAIVDVKQKRFSPGSIDYEGSIGTNYDEGRALSEQAKAVWLKAIEPFVSRLELLTILDLGAGTGRFSSLLASFPGARVIGVEPSRRMLRMASRQHCTEAISYLAGSAEAIPLGDGTCDVAWLSQVFHHIRNRAVCAAELYRVVRSGGRVFVRGAFADRLDGFPTLFRFFPGARRICEDLPTVEESVAVFEANEFALEAHHRIQQQTCGSLCEFAERTRRRTDSSLVLLSDDEFHAGLVAMEQAVAHESDPAPVLETLELLIFQRRG